MDSLAFPLTQDAVVKIVRQEGIKSLWSGLGPTICLTVPATVIYLSCYENLRLNFKDIYIRTFSGMIRFVCTRFLIREYEVPCWEPSQFQVQYQYLPNEMSLLFYYGI